MDPHRLPTITLLPGDWQVAAWPGATLLEAAEAAGVDLPSSCRNGTCRTCVCRMVSGKVRYLVEWPGLSADDRREGCVLPCVAVPVGDVVLSAPLARRRQPAEPGQG